MSDPNKTADAATKQTQPYGPGSKPNVMLNPADSGLEMQQNQLVTTTIPTMPITNPVSVYQTKADPTREYVAGGGWSWYNNAVRTLPWSIDDVTDDFGDDLYDQMLRDPVVMSCLNVIKAAVLSDPIRIIPYQTSSSEPVPPLAQEMADFCQHVLDNLQGSVDDVIWNMLDSIAYGNKVAELIFTIQMRSTTRDVEVEEDLDEDQAAVDKAEQDADHQDRLGGSPTAEDLKRGRADAIRKPIIDPAQAIASAREAKGAAWAFRRRFIDLARNVYMALNPGGSPDDLADPSPDEQAGSPQAEENKPPVMRKTAMAQVTVTRPYLVIERIKVKPRRSVAFIVDPFMNTIGILGLLPGQFNAVMSGSMFVDPSQMPPNVLPRAKFAVMTFRPKDADPRGVSALRSSFNAWWLKKQVWPEYLKYLAQYASASLIGFTAPDEEFVQQVDDQGHPIDGAYITAEQAMLAALTRIRGGSAVVFKNGSDVKPLQMTGDGEAFLKAIELFNTEMVMGILHQKLATMDSEHNTRAASATHKSTLDTIIMQARNGVVRMIRDDIIRPLVRFNWGEDAVKWAPVCTLGETDKADFAGVAAAIASLMKANYFDPSQMQDLDVMLGLTPRPQAAVEQQAAAKQAGYQLAQKVASGEIPLAGGEDGGKPNGGE